MRVSVRICSVCFVFYILFCYILTLTGFSDLLPDAMGLLTVICTIVIVCLYAFQSSRTFSDVMIVLSSLVVKIAYLVYRLLYKYGFNITEPELTTDAKAFWNAAVKLYQGGRVRTGTRFPYFLNIEFHFFGKNILCIFMNNILMTVLMSMIVISLLNRLNIRGKSRMIALSVCSFLPYEIIVSCSLLRESLYFVFIALSFYYYYRYIESNRYRNLLFAIFAMMPVLLLHPGYFSIIIVYYVDSFRHDRPHNGKQLFMRIFLLVMLIELLINGIRTDSSGGGYVLRGVSGLIRKVSGEAGSGYSDEAGSRYLTGLTIDSVPTLIFYSPIRAIFFLFSPLPTNWRGISDFFAFLADSCVHFYVIAASMKARKLLKRAQGLSKDLRVKYSRLLRVGLSIITVTAFVFCLNTNNSGTAIRHRDVLIGIEAVILGLSLKIRAGDYNHVCNS